MLDRGQISSDAKKILRRWLCLLESIQARTDPAAVWVYQTWIWRGFNSPANLDYLKGWIGAIPPGKALMLDQTAEWTPIWQKFDNFVFLGVDFIWCTMSTMGGNVGMYGDIERLNSGPIDATNAKNSSMVGVGIDPEGINTNPAYCEQHLSSHSRVCARLMCAQLCLCVDNDNNVSRTLMVCRR